jgi:hypothetical protein
LIPFLIYTKAIIVVHVMDDNQRIIETILVDKTQFNVQLETGVRKPMDTIKLTTHIGEDGILRLEVPIGVSNQNIEVVVVVQTQDSEPVDANGWPVGYFEETYGSLADHPIERPDQGTLETRDSIL